jgi:hypothetical protein
MGRQRFTSTRARGYRNREIEVDGSRRVGPTRSLEPDSLRHLSAVEQLQALAAASTVPVRKVETGARTVSDKQAFLALHATDSYRYDMRHFVGDLQTKLGVRSPQPVEPRRTVELSDEERAAEREVRARKTWGRYWARKRRQD